MRSIPGSSRFFGLLWWLQLCWHTPLDSDLISFWTNESCCSRLGGSGHFSPSKLSHCCPFHHSWEITSAGPGATSEARSAWFWSPGQCLHHSFLETFWMISICFLTNGLHQFGSSLIQQRATEPFLVMDLLLWVLVVICRLVVHMDSGLPPYSLLSNSLGPCR